MLFLGAAYGLGIAGISWLFCGIFCGYRCSTEHSKTIQHAHAIPEAVGKDPRRREDDVLQAAMV